MRVAKYSAAEANPGGRETLRFRFSDQELARIGQSYGKGSARHLRFNLVILGRNKAKLVATQTGGMAVTTSPSGKNYPWEVGFNHHSSPDILEVEPIPSSHTEMVLEPDGILVRLPDARRQRRRNARETTRERAQQRLAEAKAEVARLSAELGA